MALSVIVISYNAPTLERCLASLSAQQDAGEIVVADCSAEDPRPRLAGTYPRVRFLRFESKQSVPALRWAALRETSGAIVGSVEARSVPAPDWCARMLAAHREFPAAPAVGGPIEIARPAGARDLGLFLCEYGHVAPPLEPGAAAEISGANVSYKRADLEAATDVLEGGRWETELHLRWQALGRPLVLTDAAVTFENAMDLPTALRQRFAYGRGYAAARLPRGARPRRALYAAGGLALPLVLTARLARSLAAKGRGADFRRALPWIALFSAVWSAGEIAGYALGDSKDVRIY
jgi:hypothetical protein